MRGMSLRSVSGIAGAAASIALARSWPSWPSRQTADGPGEDAGRGGSHPGCGTGRAHQVPGGRPARRTRARHARRRPGRPLHRVAVRTARPGAGGEPAEPGAGCVRRREDVLSAGADHREHRGARLHADHPRRQEQRDLHRAHRSHRLLRLRTAPHRHQRPRRLRRLRHRRARIQVERLRGRRREGQSGDGDGRRSAGARGGADAVRRQGADLLRPLDLQGRRSGASGRGRRDPDSHGRDRDLSVEASCSRRGAARNTPSRSGRACWCSDGKRG